MNSFILAQSQQHVYGFEGTTAATIFIAGFTGLLVLVAFTVRINLRLLIVAGMLFATALTAPVNYQQFSFIQTWMLPVQKLRAEIHLALGVLLTILVIAPGRIGIQHVSFQSVLLLLLGCYMALLQYIHNDASEATQSMLFALATIPCMVIGIPLLTCTRQQCMALVRSIMIVSAIWTFCCSVQFVINPRYLVMGNGRFMGLLANPQHAAFLVAPFAIIALWLVLHDPLRRTKILWGALLAINLLFLMWTGSRTGVVMLVLGSIFVLYSRIGRAVALLPLAALMFWGLYYLSDLLQIGSTVERLVSSEDTRGHVWTQQLAAAMNNPLIGAGWSPEVGGSESSYLGGFAAFGIGCFLLILALLFGSIFYCITLLRRRQWLPANDRPLVDLFVAFNAAYFSGAAFEGYLLARSSTALTMMLMFAGIGVYLRDTIAASMAGQIEPAETWDYDHGTAGADGESAPTAA